jgi:hypothetical protein
MTFKHINFQDSEIMLNLEKIAINKNLIQNDPIIKQAAKTYKPSSNLFQDMILLVGGLREKGLVKQADDLEAKIFAHKQAKKDYDELLDKAHPEGDVEIIKAENGYGVVETLPTQHKKILDIVNKTVKTKNAEIVNGLIKAAELVLTADGINWGDGSKKEEDKAEKDNKPIDLNQIILLVNDEYSKYKENVNKLYSIIQPNTYFSFNINNILSNDKLVSLYAEKSGVDSATLNFLLSNLKKAYGSLSPESFTPEKIMNHISGALNNYEPLKSWANSFGFVDSFTGSKPNPDKEYRKKELANWGSLVTDNPGSVWNYQYDNSTNISHTHKDSYRDIFTVDTAALTSTVNSIHEKLQSELNSLINDGLIVKANEALAQELKTLLGPLASFGSLGNLENIEKKEDLNSYTNHVNTLYNLASELKSDKTKIYKYTILYNKFGQEFNLDVYYNAIQDIFISLSRILNILPADSSNPQTALNNLNKAASLLNDYAMNLGESHPDYEHWINQFKQTNKLANIVHKSIQDEKIPEIKGVKSLEDLINFSINYLNETAKLVGKKASNKNNIIKEAQDPAGGFPKPEAPPGKGGTTPAVPGKPGQGSSGRWKGPWKPADPKVSEEDRDAVRIMQTNLFNLSQELDNNSELLQKKYPETLRKHSNIIAILMKTGRAKQPSGVSPWDGLWGDNTKDSLEATNSLIQEYNSRNPKTQIKSLDVGPKVKEPNHAIYAERNTVIIKDLRKKIFAEPEAAKSYGNEYISFKGKPVEIKESDVSSLQGFLEFLEKNDIVGDFVLDEGTKQDLVDYNLKNPEKYKYKSSTDKLQEIAVKFAQNARNPDPYDQADAEQAEIEEYRLDESYDKSKPNKPSKPGKEYKSTPIKIKPTRVSKNRRIVPGSPSDQLKKHIREQNQHGGTPWRQPGAGLTFAQWLAALQHFKLNAEQLWREGGTQNKALYRELAAKLKNLITQVTNRARGKAPHDLLELEEEDPNSASGQNQGSGASASGKTKGRSGIPNIPEVDALGNPINEGESRPIEELDPTKPPVGKIIDLRLDYWDKTLPQTPLHYSQFQGASAVSMAQFLFDGVEPDEEITKEYEYRIAKALNVDPLRFDDEIGTYRVNYKGKNNFPLYKVPKYQQKKKIAYAAVSADLYKRFLIKLKKEISRIMRVWSASASADERLVLKANKDANDWTQTIIQKYHDISRYLGDQ